jgi:hypothetical protein
MDASSAPLVQRVLIETNLTRDDLLQYIGGLLPMTRIRSASAPVNKLHPYRQQSKDPRTLVPTAALISSAGVSSSSRLPVTAPALLTHRCTVPSFSAAKSPSAATSARHGSHCQCRPVSRSSTAGFAYKYVLFGTIQVHMCANMGGAEAYPGMRSALRCMVISTVVHFATLSIGFPSSP